MRIRHVLLLVINQRLALTRTRPPTNFHIAPIKITHIATLWHKTTKGSIVSFQMLRYATGCIEEVSCAGVSARASNCLESYAIPLG
ncbi:MAG: hypothetical protein JWO59_650 [Chloroflexi bacterium]|nr:hypothetical protein [Chloroflexota bacterium]